MINEYVIESNDLEKLSITVRRLLGLNLHLAQSRQSMLENTVDFLPEASLERVLQSNKLQPLIRQNVNQTSNGRFIKNAG